MAESTPPRKSLAATVLDLVGTRLQMASLEMKVAKNNSVRILIASLLCTIFGILALVFVSIALLAVFWQTHRIFVACAVAAFYLVMALYFYGRAKGLAANMPYAFELTSQVLRQDVEDIKKRFDRSAPARDETAPEIRQGDTHAG